MLLATTTSEVTRKPSAPGIEFARQQRSPILLRVEDEINRRLADIAKRAGPPIPRERE